MEDAPGKFCNHLRCVAKSDECMNHECGIIDVFNLGFRPKRTSTSEESMNLHSLVAGKTNKKVRKSLPISASICLRLLRDMWARTGTTTSPALLLWARRR